jgi:hypothetical protein
MSEPPPDPYNRPGRDQPPGFARQRQPFGPKHGPGGVYVAVLGRSVDLVKVVLVLAWLVAALYALAYIYGLSQGDDFADQFFGGMPSLGEGLFFSGVLHAVAVWLSRQRERR